MLFLWKTKKNIYIYISTLFLTISLYIGSESLLRLNKLEMLDLGSNLFNQNIIQSLRLLKSLKTLSLAANLLEGSFPVKGKPICHNIYLKSIWTIPHFSRLSLFFLFSFFFFFFFYRNFHFWKLGDVGFKI